VAEQKLAGKFAHRDAAAIAAIDGNEIATLLSGAETAGRFAVREIIADPGAAPIPNAGIDGNCYVFVVAGEWQIEAGGEIRTTKEGVAVFVPAGEAYSARLSGATRGKLLEIAAPVVPK
jgi:mannose-6-phosphate isomerase-like protein (cupin superfamily)